MAQKHLHELLKEDQEPFYITNKLFHFSSPKTSSLQIKKIQKPINQTPTFKFYKNTCFSSSSDSPELRKSPLYLPSPATKKSPENGKFALHVPARTATLLLEAAMRIQKQQSSSKPRPQIKKVKFGIFGSILKRLKDRNSALAQTHEMPNNAACNGSMGSMSSSDPAYSGRFKKDRKDTLAEILNKAAYNTLSEVVHDENFNALSSAFNNNKEKFMDLETFSNNGGFGSCSLRPFRFSLQRCSSSGDVMPEFTSPAASPACHKKEEKENHETIALENIDQLEEDEKEQCSPISVLDPPFEEEDDHDQQENKEEDYDLDCSYALVQRAQQQLLYKLRRFEKLAELDPIELEKLLLEEEDNEDPVEEKEYQVSDLISVEKPEVKSLNYGEAVFGRECKRLDSYSGLLTQIDASEIPYRLQELRSNNTIEMIVKSDLISELDEWNKFQEQREEIAIQFAFYIFGLLVEELGDELIHLAHS